MNFLAMLMYYEGLMNAGLDIIYRPSTYIYHVKR